MLYYSGISSVWNTCCLLVYSDTDFTIKKAMKHLSKLVRVCVRACACVCVDKKDEEWHKTSSCASCIWQRELHVHCSEWLCEHEQNIHLGHQKYDFWLYINVHWLHWFDLIHLTKSSSANTEILVCRLTPNFSLSLNLKTFELEVWSIVLTEWNLAHFIGYNWVDSAIFCKIITPSYIITLVGKFLGNLAIIWNYILRMTTVNSLFTFKIITCVECIVSTLLLFLKQASWYCHASMQSTDSHSFVK